MNEKAQSKELARLYYMQGEQQKIIAEKVGVNENTISRWVQVEHWDTKRAAMNITRPEIVNKILALISKILEQVQNLEEIDIKDLTKIITQIDKLSNSIQKLDKQASVVDNIETFRNFNHWLEARMSYDENVTPELMQKWLNFKIYS